MKKDYWVTCFKIFSIMSVLTATTIIIVLLVLGANAKLPSGMAIFLVVFGIVYTALWSVIARMFKRKSPKAIVAGYVLLSVPVALTLVKDLMNPSSIGASSLLFYLLYSYFFYSVYKAQKQSSNQIKA